VAVVVAYGVAVEPDRHLVVRDGTGRRGLHRGLVAGTLGALGVHGLDRALLVAAYVVGHLLLLLVLDNPENACDDDNEARKGYE
jgi:hypothetical protein